MMKTIEKPYTHILRELRKAFDLKQKEIAEVLGIQPITYNRYECGKSEMPVRFLIALAQYYDVTTDYILGLSDDLSNNIITIIANQEGEQNTHILRELRKAFDLKQKEIAEVLGVQPVTYNRYECGKCEMPVRFLIALAQYYDVSTDYILGLSDDLSDNIITIIANQKGEQMIVPCFHLRTSNGDIRHIYPSSGGEKNDVSIEVCNKIHYTKNFWKDGKMCIPKTVCLTEGALIANVSAELSGKCFIAIPSVNACGELLKELDFLKKHGCKKIELYFDMDYRTSEDFTGAIKRIGKMIIRSGLKGEQKVWNPHYKRIDDWYLSRKQKI